MIRPLPPVASDGVLPLRKGEKTKVIFLDRDGTINVDSGFVHSKQHFHFAPGAQEALKRLQEAGFILAVVTNQSGIGHGFYTEEDMHELHRHMVEELAEEGVSLAKIAYCPHRRDGNCDCRKPKRGMIDQVAAEVGEIDYEQSWVIGDKLSDTQMGKEVGAKTALIKSEYWGEADLEEGRPDVVVDDLAQAAGKIIGGRV